MEDKSNNELARDILIIVEELMDRGLTPEQTNELLMAELNNLTVIKIINEILKLGNKS